MTFTDEDLKLLKEKIKYLNSCHWIDLHLRRDGQNIKQEGDWIKRVWNLVARLEAGEALIPWAVCQCGSGSSCHCGYWEKKEAWRKAAGQ